MKLKNRNLAPVGGYFYLYDLTKDGVTYPVRVTARDGGLEGLARRVRADMQANKVEIPANLEELIEDQICSRQPEGYCWKGKGLGDIVAGGIQAVAGAVDVTVKAVTGKSPELKKKRKIVVHVKKEKNSSTKLDEGDKLEIKGKKSEE